MSIGRKCDASNVATKEARERESNAWIEQKLSRNQCINAFISSNHGLVFELPFSQTPL